MRLEPAPRRLEILFLYSRPPLPMTRGDELTVSHLLEFLHARGHAVDFVTLIEPGQSLRPEHAAWLESRCRSVELIPHAHQAQPAARRARLARRLAVPDRPAPQRRPARPRARAGEPRAATTWPTPTTSARPRPCARPAARAPTSPPSWPCSCRRRSTPSGSPGRRRRPGTGCSTASRPGGWPPTRRGSGRTSSRTVLIGEQDRAAIAKACREHGLARDRQCRLGAARRRRRAVQAAARGRGGRHGRDVGRDALRAQRRGGLVVRARGLAAGPGRAARRRASSWSAATRPPACRRSTARTASPSPARSRSRPTGSRARRCAWRRSAPPPGCRTSCSRPWRWPRPWSRRPSRQRGHQGTRWRGRVAGPRSRARSREAVLALLADPDRRRRAGCCRAGVRRGQVDLGGPVPGAGGGVPRHLTPDAASDRRPDFCCTAQSTPCSRRLLLPSYCASQQNPEMPPMAKPTLPEFKLPELKLPKFDLDALFGLQKANLPSPRRRRASSSRRSRRSSACSTATRTEVVETLKTAAKTKEPAKPETVLADVQAADPEGGRRRQAGRRPRRRRPAAGGRAGQPARQGQCRRAEGDRRLSSGSAQEAGGAVLPRFRRQHMAPGSATLPGLSASSARLPPAEGAHGRGVPAARCAPARDVLPLPHRHRCERRPWPPPSSPVRSPGSSPWPRSRRCVAWRGRCSWTVRGPTRGWGVGATSRPTRSCG